MNTESQKSKKIGNVKVYFSTLAHFNKLKKSFLYIKKQDLLMYKRTQHLLKCVYISDEIQGYYNNLITEKGLWILGAQIFKDAHYPVEYVASNIVHETHHLIEYADGIEEYGEEAELRAYIVQKEFLENAGRKKDVEFLIRKLEERWWEAKSTDNKSREVMKRIRSLF